QTLFVFHKAKKFNEQLDVYRTLLSSCQMLYDTICEENEKYIALCSQYGTNVQVLPGIEQLGGFSKDGVMDDWLSEYYTVVSSFPPSKWKAFYENNTAACTGFILKADEDMQLLLSDCEKLSRYLDMLYDLYLSDFNIDLFTFYLALFKETIQKELPPEPISNAIENLIQIIEQQTKLDPALRRNRFAEYRSLIPSGSKKTAGSFPHNIDAGILEKIRHSLVNSLDTITNYAGLDDAEKKRFQSLVTQYTALPDRSSSEAFPRSLRKELTALYYTVYKKAFFKSISDTELPAILKMFFYFGYTDEALAGEDNAVYLYYLSMKLTPDENGRVFTFYDWLLQLYHGKKETCVNELNIDYPAYLHKSRVENKITEAEETLALQDGEGRVNYELDNMFHSTNKIVSGHIISFCP
ncbi:MAG TPA: hypothetical protein PLU43_11690, partial [Lachnospiraceae bacterium]|nr:hypothetical protein [Lachnospiraceae bacterium]